MIRVFFALIISVSLVFSASTKDKINKNRKTLKSTSSKEKLIQQKMNSVARDILNGQKKLSSTDVKIQNMQKQIDRLKQNSKEASIKLESLIGMNDKLIKNKKELEKKIINIIAEKFSFYLVADKDYQESSESIIGDEVLAKMDAILKKDFQKLTHDYENTNSTIKKHNDEIEGIQKSLKSLKDKQSSLKKLKSKREQSVAKLKKKKSSYKKQLEKVVAQRNALRKTLQKLKIIKAQEDEEAKERARRRAEARRRANNSKTPKYDKNSKLSVKQFGSSYLHGKVKRYRGSKTIAPLSSYTVKKKFGNYIDPIYKIKIFNESVVLRSKSRDAKVKNVLNGKVIFAKDTPMLERVVIVENSLGIHTIYAHLSKIAPTVRVGKRIKKGYILGRVSRDLTFEVTQKNYHINPLQMIR